MIFSGIVTWAGHVIRILKQDYLLECMHVYSAKQVTFTTFGTQASYLDRMSVYLALQEGSGYSTVRVPL